MGIKVRKGVFETNSSSMHSITISNKTTLNNEYNLLFTNENNKIEVEFGEFGWGYKDYNDPYNKLSYLATMIISTEECEKPEDFYKTNGWKQLNKEISKYLHCDGLKLISEMKEGSWVYNGKTEKYVDCDGYIDPQSCDNYNSLKDFLDKNEINIIDFVFNPNIHLIIDNDNNW